MLLLWETFVTFRLHELGPLYAPACPEHKSTHVLCLPGLYCDIVQVYCELAQYQSQRFLDPLGSLLDGCAVDEAAAAAASPAFMCGAVLLPLMDTLMCQVCCCHIRSLVHFCLVVPVGYLNHMSVMWMSIVALREVLHVSHAGIWVVLLIEKPITSS